MKLFNLASIILAINLPNSGYLCSLESFTCENFSNHLLTGGQLAISAKQRVFLASQAYLSTQGSLKHTRSMCLGTPKCKRGMSNDCIDKVVEAAKRLALLLWPIVTSVCVQRAPYLRHRFYN